jgi:hypothetical protein
MTNDFDVVKQGEPDNEVSTESYEKPEEVELSENLFRDFRAQRTDWNKQGEEDSDFRDGAQWSREDIAYLTSLQMSPSVVNVVYPAVDSLKANLTANKPKFSSTGREGSDLKVGSMFANIVSYVWDKSLGAVQLKQSIDDAVVRGMGAFILYSDPSADNGKGEVCFKSISPRDIYVDPNSKDIFCRDAAHILLSTIVTRAQLQQTYPEIFNGKLPPIQETVDDDIEATDKVGNEGQGSANAPHDPSQTKYRIIDRYSKIKQYVFHAYDQASGMEKLMSNDEYASFLKEIGYIEISRNEQPRYLTSPADVAAADKLYRRYQGTFHYANPQNSISPDPIMLPGPEDSANDANMGLTTIPGSTIRLVRVTMEDFIKMGVVTINQILVDRILRVYSIGGWLFYKGVMKISDHCIVPLMFRHNRTPYPMSDVRFVRPIQEYINKLRSLIIAHASNSTSVKLLIPRGGIDPGKLEQEWGKAGTAVIEFDAEIGMPVVAGPVPLPNELYRNEQVARNDVQEILGVYNLSQGDASAAPDTYKGTVAIDEYGQRRMKSKKDDVEEFLNQVCRVLIELIQDTYTYPKTMRIIRPNNTPFELTINNQQSSAVEDLSDEVVKIGDITVGKYDVIVVSGSTLPVNRWARFEYYKQLFELGIIDQVEVLKQTEVADMDGVLKRTSQIKILQQQLQQAVDEIKKLQGDMQTLERENVHANQRVELEKYKSQLDSYASKAEAATHLYGARLTDSVQNAKVTLAANIKAKSSQAKPKKGK